MSTAAPEPKANMGQPVPRYDAVAKVTGSAKYAADVPLVNPAYAYFHKWQPNDMVVWDNWRVIHSAAGVPLHCARRARRTTIMGDYEVGRYLDPELDRERKVKRLVD